MSVRRASCSCGQLQLACEGEPVRISMCHCLACQQRTGSVFGVQARFPREAVTAITGRSTSYVRVEDSGNSSTFHFCPECGTTVYWEFGTLPEMLAVAVGAFADPSFPAPRVSVYEERRHAWALPTAIELEHMD
ncbi:GFA family protein [Pyxidicoccus xibeiensis]|uniref:GFA family protein n=1 Tax=Pyxidicoccus xibeiensis TaxID=2906759 RepID=UPI0020A786A4|nr:GFA family protein [Pyxidicoccus xibeiensis]MCP3138945.1 GFA family protein [Pyxidicoccus xibeiensis]